MEKREKHFNRVIPIFFVIFLIWVLLQFLAPLALPTGSVDELSGYAGVADNTESIDDMPLPWNHVYSCGDRLCHQKTERSFYLNDNQMPFCSRCTAIWIGLVIGLGFMVFYSINLDGKFIFVIIIGLIPIGIDGIGQLLMLWESTNIMRVITGLLIGVVCGISIGIIIDEIKTIRYFKKTKSL
jgi:uncharacterized membrane protein